MNENKSYVKFRSGSSRNFGLVFSIMFLIVAFYTLLHNEKIYFFRQLLLPIIRLSK